MFNGDVGFHLTVNPVKSGTMYLGTLSGSTLKPPASARRGVGSLELKADNFDASACPGQGVAVPNDGRSRRCAGTFPSGLSHGPHAPALVEVLGADLGRQLVEAVARHTAASGGQGAQQAGQHQGGGHSKPAPAPVGWAGARCTWAPSAGQKESCPGALKQLGSQQHFLLLTE